MSENMKHSFPHEEGRVVRIINGPEVPAGAAMGTANPEEYLSEPRVGLQSISGAEILRQFHQGREDRREPAGRHPDRKRPQSRGETL
jgi:hypothetical protein